MNAENELKPQVEIPQNLKELYQSLQEINKILSSPANQLDILVNGDNPTGEDALKGLSDSGTAPSIKNLAITADGINKKAHIISNLATKLAGI